MTGILACAYVCMLVKSDTSTPYEARTLQSCLQQFLGPSPTVFLESFSNSDTLVSYEPVFVTRPKSVEEIQRTLWAALVCGRHVRAVGGGHSTEPLWADQGHINVDLSELNLYGGQKIILQSREPVHQYQQSPNEHPVALVRVSAGLTQGELNRELEAVGYAFPPGPIITDATLGGAIATASHNSIHDQPSIGGFMTRARLIDGYGYVREFSEDTDPVIMKALRCNLGLLGIVFEIELKVIPQQDVITRHVFTPLRNLFDPNFLRDAVFGSYLMMGFYAPYNSLTEEEGKKVLTTGKVPKTWNSANDLVLLRYMNLVSDPRNFTIKDERPSHVPNVTKISLSQDAFKTHLSFPVQETAPLSRAIHVPASVIPLAKTTEYTMDDFSFVAGGMAFEVLSSVLNEASHTEGVQAVEEGIFKWFSGTDCLICPGSVPVGGRGSGEPVNLSRFTTIHVHRNPGLDVQETDAIQRALVAAWDSQGLRGLPHWGKGFLQFPNLKTRIKRGYGADLEVFKKIRKYLDREGIFTNTLLREIFDIHVPGNKFGMMNY